MDVQTLTRKANSIKRTMINLTAYTNEPFVAEKFTAMLESANFEDILIKTCPDFNEWINRLPTEPIIGLGEACREWIRYWGIGGGDCSTEDQIKSAIGSLAPNDDVPKRLADAMYSNIANYSKTAFEASVLIMDIITDCLAECESESKED